MDIRKIFLDYFVKNNHSLVESSSLIPAEDKTLLFTNSGMVQFKDAFLGIKKPRSSRIVSCQKCVRAGGKHNDLENIGYTNRHHSFFEMLGNFSFGNYFKEEAINLAWNFLTKELQLDVNKLYISVHKDDIDSSDIWLKQIKIAKDKLWYLGDKDNFWQMGDTGPCGPCTEIYYDLGDKLKGSPASSGDPGDRFIEIWNLVFTQYDRDSNNKLNDLPKKCVDTGMGLERIHAVVEGKLDNFKTSIFADLENYLDHSLNNENINYTIKKIIMDHSRSSCFLISDGVIPNNEGRGYVLRRILRRATRFLYNAGIKEPFIYKCTDILEKSMGDIYSSLKTKKKAIKEIIYAEEENYLSTLEKGLNLINKLTKNTDKISGEEIFKLYDTYGFPTEIIQEIASEKNISLDMMSFEKLMSKQKNLSKKNTAFSSDALSFVDKNLISSFEGYNQNSLSAKVLAIYKDGSIVDLVQVKDSELIIIFDKTPFYPEGGGQISDIGVLENNDCSLSIVNVQKIGNSIVHKAVLKNGTIKKSDEFNLKIDTRRRKSIAIHHSSTHLLHQALRDVLGNHVEQKGSLVTDAGLRFDFSHNKALSKDEISRIEKIIAFEIDEAKKTSINQMSYKDAIKAGALAFFDEKYEDDVRVLNIGTKSMELCGGTHVDNTNDIKIFKILNEQSISNGVRRIEAVAGNEAYNEFQKAFNLNRDIASLLGVSPDKIANKIDSFKHNESVQQKAIKKLNKQLVSLFSKTINSFVSNKTNIFLQDCSNLNRDQIKDLIDEIKSIQSNSISVLYLSNENKIDCFIGVSKKCTHEYNAKKLLEILSKKYTLKGGGSDTFATLIIDVQDKSAFHKTLEQIFNVTK